MSDSDDSFDKNRRHDDEDDHDDDEEEQVDEEEPEGEDLDDDEDDEEEDEDSDEPIKHGSNKRSKKKSSKKKRKKPRHGGFILEEAEVDSEIEDDEEWEEGAQPDIIDNKLDSSDHSDRNQHRRLQMILTSEEDQIENYYRMKYAEPTSVAHGYDGDAELSNNISQQALMPGVKDPNLWMVKCRIGEEKQTVLQLMRKFIAHQNSDDPLQIKSVVAPEGIKGYIYIEAYKQTHVKQAIQNVGNLRLGLYKQTMVPIAEMTEVLKVTKDTSNLKVGQWVRLKRGLYKDDLAQVDYVDVAQNQVHLKLIPRIDYTRLRGALRAPGNDSQNNDDGDNKKKRFKKPAAKLFDMDAIRSIGGEVTNDGDFIIFESNRYRRGFLYKAFNMNAIQVEGVKPTLAELERFEEHPEGMEIHLTESTLAEDRGHSFAAGDNIEVISGELKGLTGKILTIEGNLIKMLANHEDLDAPLPFQPHELRKYFKPGDHVKVIAGRYEGDTGLIIRVEDDQIVLFSDLTMHELRVLHKDLQLCSDMATGVDSMGQYQWGDLVHLDAQTVGVIVRLERENFHVLNMHDRVVQVKPQAILRKRDSKRAVSLDSDSNQIQVKDQVRVHDGPYTGRQGEIKHLYRGIAFLYSRMVLENGGIFACKTRHLLLQGASKAPPASAGGNLQAGYMSPRVMQSPAHPSAATGGGSPMPRQGFQRSGRDRNDLNLIGKTIKITQGHYKGYIGIVKDAIGATARVELHTSCQTITVDKTRIALVTADGRILPNSAAGRTPGMDSAASTPNPYAGSRTPSYGSQTPMHSGSRTPLHDPSRTPLHDGSRTPAWDSGATPRPEFEDYLDTSPSPGTFLAPNTPSYNNPETPQAYTPATPGSDSTPYSPYPTTSPSPSGSGGYLHGIVPSPGYLAPSPASTGSATYHNPHSVGPSPAPFGYSPMTPDVNFHLNPQTPGVGIGSDPSGGYASDWLTTDMEVRIKSIHQDEDLIGQHGFIRSISGSMCSVFLPKEDRVVSILSSNLEPVEHQQT
ncbi:transcription elongation factor subunit Spt5 [Dermatophagoides farinae]|uniref:transcription elongation factor subunit Spt5 n=1 Tax=Dermatophagoides farinae TaxID=6954 RepID=UPI003F5FA0A6